MNGHAFLALGGEDAVPVVLRAFGREESDADVYVRVHRSFGVDDARALCARASMRGSARGSGRLFVVVAATITHEAQNALLKTLEEPPAGARFCIITPAPEMLLPTVRSRTQTLTLEKHDAGSSGQPISVSDFLRTSAKGRLDMLAPLLEKDDNDERDTGTIVRFLSALETALAPHIQKREVREGIAAIYRARAYLADKGAMTKVLLEQVALLVPVL